MTLWNRAKLAVRTLFALTPGPADDFWYSPIGGQTASGQTVNPSTALQLGSVLASVRRLSTSVASLPLFLYRRVPGGKEPARDHPLFEILHSRPNDRQTSFQFRMLLQQWVEIYSNAYAAIVSGPRGGVDQLLPLHPSRVQIRVRPDGRRQYEYRPQVGALRVYLEGEVFHLMGFSEGGNIGTPITEVGAEAIGMGLAAQDYAARYFKNDATPGGVLKHPKPLSDVGHERLRKEWVETHGGEQRHGPAILEEGMEFQVITADLRRSQVMELREHQVEEVARIFGLPPHKIGDLRRSTYSNIEHQGLEYVQDAILQRCVNWEQAIARDLLLGRDRDQYFAEHLIAGLQRGDLASRYNAYAVGRQWGWLSVNEIRALENMNAGTGGDRYLEPMNMVPAGSPPAAAQASADSRPWLLAGAAAERIFRRETMAVAKAREKFSGDDFRAWAEAWYIGHARFVGEALRVGPEESGNYTEQQLALLLGGNDEWKTTATERLTLLGIARC